ncbi:MAG: formylglycine-generating enzyme family protein [Verrucomicrobia bacterium]|nr:formylglycine-generating enzyme family protein [Verrucomicrobiota bacterium]
MRNAKFFLFVLLVASIASVANAADPVLPIITNLVAVQRPGSFIVDVTYDLIDPDSPGGVYILSEASSNNGTNYGISMLSLSGDAGLVTPGTGKKLVWNAWNDWARNYTTNARVRLIGDDFPSTIGSTNGGNYTTNVPPATNLVWIPPGTFTMGPDLYGGKTMYVYLTRGIWMGKFEVTQAEYQNVLSNNPSYFTGSPNRPVEQVTWDEAVQYCQRLTARERIAGRIDTHWTYRLPTEAEWEYACRAGTTTTYCFGEDPYGNRLGFYAWYSVNAGDQTHEVGSRAPNRWGLYDMHGNVWEWCQDFYNNYPGGNVTDPQGPSSGSNHVMRGGSWGSAGSYWATVNYCSSANRNIPASSNRGVSTFGFRVVLAPAQ